MHDFTTHPTLGSKLFRSVRRTNGQGGPWFSGERKIDGLWVPIDVEDYFYQLKEAGVEFTPGPCAKAVVTCELRMPGLRAVVGENRCRRPQEVCPRNRGDDYTKCRTICDQVGHSEIDALARARELGLSVAGATATLRGHTYFCRPCQEALFGAGVAALSIAV